MRIDFVEIQNFRRLNAVRIDFSEKTTLLVGANNSGKTSAITALRYFLMKPEFSVHDIPLQNWTKINNIGNAVEEGGIEACPQNWEDILPSLDIWFMVSETEIHHVSHLIPTLEWKPAEGIGVRLQLQPKKADEFAKAYLKSRKAASEVLNGNPSGQPSNGNQQQNLPDVATATELDLAARIDPSQLATECPEQNLTETVTDLQPNVGIVVDSEQTVTEVSEQSRIETATDAQPDGAAAPVLPGDNQNQNGRNFSLWPKNLIEFLAKHFSDYLAVSAYILDPSKKMTPIEGIAQPQSLPSEAESLDENPLKGLIKIDEVPAHRGLSDYSNPSKDGTETEQVTKGRGQLLTAQLRAYYSKHLDPLKAPDRSDIDALRAIHDAQSAFDKRLEHSFESALKELEGLGYPGVTNPKLKISTSIKPVEGLNHQSAVQYEVAPQNNGADPHRLPEQCNGLGYQNLISMVFRLISFRDDWLKVGKAAPVDEETGEGLDSPPPLHLVLLEEPEVHLHVQVQQVFIRKAYAVLRNHLQLQDRDTLSTQLVVSTHSSNIAHEVDFAQMRYFKRLPAKNPGETPISTVINLSEVFGTRDDTAKFVSRYLQSTHADLFFADGAILLEGAGERILLPHFIRNKYEILHSCYLTLLEVGGSHAHTLRPLIEHLGLNTLIITDIDAVKRSDRGEVQPAREHDQITANNVLRSWHPLKESIDELLDLAEPAKEKIYNDSFCIRVAYQTPQQTALNETDPPTIVFPRTFEDALALHNLEFFRSATGSGFVKKIRDAIENNTDVASLHTQLLIDLKSIKKAQFALDVLYSRDLESLKVPGYISEGLVWLQTKLTERREEVLVERQLQATTVEGA